MTTMTGNLPSLMSQRPKTPPVPSTLRELLLIAGGDTHRQYAALPPSSHANTGKEWGIRADDIKFGAVVDETI